MTVTQEKRIKAPGELAQRYGRAFYDYLAGNSARAEILQRVCALYSAILESEPLRVALADRRLDSRQAERFVTTLAERLALGDEIRRFAGVVARQGRLSRLGEMLEAVLSLDAKQRGEVQVEVSTATALNDTQRTQLQESLKKAGFEHIIMNERLIPALIGGMTLRVGSILFDTSVAGRLTRLQNAMKGAA